MAYSTDVEAARLLATQAHSCQTDNTGLPYICQRKYNSDFAQEMSRSVAEYLKQFDKD